MPYFSVSMPYFFSWIFWHELQIYREYGFLINLNIIHEPILTLKISVKNFCRFLYFVDFDFEIVLLGQNSFEPIAF